MQVAAYFMNRSIMPGILFTLLDCNLELNAAGNLAPENFAAKRKQYIENTLNKKAG